MGKVLLVENSFTGELAREGELMEVVVSYSITGGNSHRWALYLTEEQVQELAEQYETWSAREDELLTEERTPVQRKSPVKRSGGSDTIETTPEQKAAIRAWANANGEHVAERGRIARSIVEAWFKETNGSLMETEEGRPKTAVKRTTKTPESV